MSLRTFVLGALLATACVASAQTPQVMQVRPSAIASAAQIDRVPMLEKQVASLREENERLKRENAALKADIDSYRMLGGSQVHAFCEGSVSKNTAGASNDCSNAGYTCESVSGLCHTSCQTSDMCSGGFVCDTGIQQCVRP
jgi:hypothetical protein